MTITQCCYSQQYKGCLGVTVIKEFDIYKADLSLGAYVRRAKGRGLGTVNGFASGLWARRNRMSSPGWSMVRQNRHRLGAIDGTWLTRLYRKLV
nr:NADH dehydrogenase [ubiquinone] iron-sulfur protein 2 [Tanacetum cinerariifolium]GEZ38739.1 NADH dehydrogenase [ubiquinone] iron-sulfur protein 2 [Tanacetum cinerariifolium]